MRDAVDVWIIYKFSETYELFCDIVDQQKAFILNSSQDHCQISSPSRISDTLPAVIFVCFGLIASKHIFPYKDVINKANGSKIELVVLEV